MKGVIFPVGQNWEDAYIVVDVVKNATKLVVIGEALYYYRVRSGSITQSTHWSKHMWDGIYTYYHIYNQITREYPALISIAKARLCWVHRVSIAMAATTEEWKEHIAEIKIKKRYIRGNLRETMKNPYVSLFGKIDTIIAVVFPARIYGLLRRTLRYN